MFAAPGSAPTSITYDVAPAGPVVGTGTQERFTAAGVAALAAGVTDTAAFGGAGGGSAQISCAVTRLRLRFKSADESQIGTQYAFRAVLGRVISNTMNLRVVAASVM